MVITGDRREALKVLRDYLSGRITNREVEDSYPTGSGDEGVRAVYSQLWLSWSDSREHKFDPSLLSAVEIQATFQRCELFLGSTLEYEWHKGARLGSWLQLLLRTFRLRTLAERVAASEVREAQRVGDWHVWPFRRQSDLQNLTRDA